MTVTEERRLRRLCCNAVVGLCRTVRTMRQHAAVPRLAAAARARCIDELAALLGETDLVVLFRDGEVTCAGQAVLTYNSNDVPFGLLAEQGIGELVLQRGTTAATIDRLLAVLTAARSPASDDDDLAADLHYEGLAGLHLRVPPEPTVPLQSDGRHADWWLLPEPRRDDALQQLVERDLATNVPALAARLLLADLRAGRTNRTQAASCLDELLGAMLGSGDLASAAWLLEQAEHGPVLPAEFAALRAAALATFDDEWLAEQLEHDDRIAGLVTLALQLGDEGYARLLAAAAGGDMALPDWVTSLLPPPA